MNRLSDQTFETLMLLKATRLRDLLTIRIYLCFVTDLVICAL